MYWRDTYILFQSVDDLGTSYSAITSPKTALLSTDLEEEWKHNERPLNAMAIQKDRKRYHLVLTSYFVLLAFLTLQIDSNICHKCVYIYMCVCVCVCVCVVVRIILLV